MKPAASRRVSFSVFCSKDLPVTFVFAPPAPVPLLMMAGVGVVGASRLSPAMFIFCFSFFGLGVGAVVFGVVGGVFSTCSSTFSMTMMMLIRDIAYYIYFNFLILLIE